jgi:hypothetical protein
LLENRVAARLERKSSECPGGPIVDPGISPDLWSTRSVSREAKYLRILPVQFEMFSTVSLEVVSVHEDEPRDAIPQGCD